MSPVWKRMNVGSCVCECEECVCVCDIGYGRECGEKRRWQTHLSKIASSWKKRGNTILGEILCVCVQHRCRCSCLQSLSWNTCSNRPCQAEQSVLLWSLLKFIFHTVRYSGWRERERCHATAWVNLQEPSTLGSALYGANVFVGRKKPQGFVCNEHVLQSEC